ncbi:hypothetical protein, partial [Pontibacter pamirensis]|uniref:hypothetical protein n=1 Tax=Pontibacter pamirensis TaxID=2562824 RepID=UPI001F351176
AGTYSCGKQTHKAGFCHRYQRRVLHGKIISKILLLNTVHFERCEKSELLQGHEIDRFLTASLALFGSRLKNVRNDSLATVFLR